jgi:hypothetical protein
MLRYVLALGLFAVAPAALAQSEPPFVFAETATYPPGDPAGGKRTLEALEKPVGKFLLEQVPLDQALEQWSRLSGVSAAIEWKVLETVAVSRRSPVSINVAQVPADRALRILLDQVSPNAALSYLVSGNAITISTVEEFHSGRYQVVSVYDVRSLYLDVEYDSREADEISARLIDALQTAIEPNSWRDHGGASGSARILNGRLIVTQSPDLQERVSAFVQDIREGTQLPTRAYDVRDLVKEDLQPSAGGAAPNRMDGLINAIQTTCGRDTWRGLGGKSSSIAAFEGKIFVTANGAVQQQIERLLALMRKK